MWCAIDFVLSCLRNGMVHSVALGYVCIGYESEMELSAHGMCQNRKSMPTKKKPKCSVKVKPGTHKHEEVVVMTKVGNEVRVFVPEAL